MGSIRQKIGFLFILSMYAWEDQIRVQTIETLTCTASDYSEVWSQFLRGAIEAKLTVLTRELIP